MVTKTTARGSVGWMSVLCLGLLGSLVVQQLSFAQAERKPQVGTQIFLCNKPGMRPDNELVLLEYEKRVLLVSTSPRLPGKERYFSCSWGNGGALFQSVTCLATLPGNEALWQLSLSYNKVGNRRTLQGLSLKPDRAADGGGPLHLGSYSCEQAKPGTERGRDE
ncbi:hypothetical protein ACTL6U_19985 [Rhodovibrionaceae bacterium A322]